ncbi:facilitated trehalose transporter Tret1-like isoform X2 [Pectinophora gossypiella]|uniref:facilitated trehalose transporter Tret1-like isoform X2 n=1 Tax=Pectinophora gossypiella TaxID=13191 RepID=UPI00214DF3D5|nr:facilitated trehalose transporter Tret1-like isoform X2 [Pectinophora gossypiella]
MAATASLALLFGNLLSGYLMERYGRRNSQVVLAVFFISGWVVIGFAKNMAMILVGRFITGLSQGWLGPLGPVFIGEISTPAYRGFFLAGLSLAIAVGVLMSHVFGTLLHWSYASLLCGLFPLIGGVILYFAPETPAWLATQNRIDKCIESFKWYRGTCPEMKAELDKIIAAQEKRDQSMSKLSALKANIVKPEFYKPLTIMTVFFIMTQLSGVNVISAYTTDLVKELMGSKKYADAAMLSLDVLRCASLLVACVLLKKKGRRPMAMISGIFTSLSLIALAIYMFSVKRNRISPVITIGLMTVYMIVSNLGVVPLPWNMVGELFATETKGIGSGISVMTTSVAYFATIKTAPGMLEGLGHHGTYMFYGLSTLLGTIYLYFYLPETRGKTLLQIEEYFRYGKKGRTKDVDNDASIPCV